jgi:hypothetical protein
MSDIQNNDKINISEECKFAVTRATHLEVQDGPDEVLAMKFNNQTISVIVCDLEVVSLFLGLGLKYQGHFDPAVIFEFFSVPITNLQALLLAGFFEGLDDSEKRDLESYEDWLASTFDSRFNAGYKALKAQMDGHGFEMPESLVSNHDNAEITRAELAKVVSYLDQMDAPLNQIMLNREDFESDIIFGIILESED